MLMYVWTHPDGTRIASDLFAPRAFKTYDLQPPNLQKTVQKTGNSYTITLTAEALALFVALEADQPGQFSGNAAMVTPGHAVTLTFTPKTSGAEPQFTLRDLHSATY
jgi:beta-mannosidase